MSFNFFSCEKKTSAAEQKRFSEIFNEKYKPKTLDKVIGQDNITSVLRKCKNNMPHLLFYGPPGSGKTTTINALCNELYGNRNIKNCVLHLNASDECGISVVRDKIKHFAQFGTGTNQVTFKFVILDEADNITDDAQTALRRTIEIYSRTTRFCLICNSLSNISHPLRSRCAIFRFKTVPQQNIVSHIQCIVERENINVSPSVITNLVNVYENDIRQILIQIGALSCVGDKVITKDDTFNTFIPQSVMKEFIQCGQRQNFTEIITFVKSIISRGYSNVLKQLCLYVLSDESLCEDFVKRTVQLISECEEKMVNGSDDTIQLLWLASNLKPV